MSKIDPDTEEHEEQGEHGAKEPNKADGLHGQGEGSEIAKGTDQVQADRETAGEKPQVSKPPRRGLSVFAGLVLGGICAASIGFYAARYVVPDGWPFPGVTPEPNPIAITQDAQAVKIAELEASLQAQSKALLALEQDSGQDSEQDRAAQVLAETNADNLASMQAQLGETTGALQAFDARLTALEKMPVGDGSAAADLAAAAYERELAVMREMLSTELARIETAGQEALAAGQGAQSLAAQSNVVAALAQLRGAQDSGQPFDGILREIGAQSETEIPDMLESAAKVGIETLPELQNAFPPAARAALDAAIQAGVDDGSVGRLSGFFQRQLGMRSLEVQEGDSADAVLSRAEAALKTGNIALALQELAVLPPEGRAAMVEWVALAETRQSVLAATEDLFAMLNKE